MNDMDNIKFDEQMTILTLTVFTETALGLTLATCNLYHILMVYFSNKIKYPFFPSPISAP